MSLYSPCWIRRYMKWSASHFRTMRTPLSKLTFLMFYSIGDVTCRPADVMTMTWRPPTSSMPRNHDAIRTTIQWRSTRPLTCRRYVVQTGAALKPWTWEIPSAPPPLSTMTIDDVTMTQSDARSPSPPLPISFYYMSKEKMLFNPGFIFVQHLRVFKPA